jgi:hypothetical protein
MIQETKAALVSQASAAFGGRDIGQQTAVIKPLSRIPGPEWLAVLVPAAQLQI